ncbi:hypothetical protein E2C01_042706 [Portunus trituberculatus]|uniref:Uncharacterized protein n=1 Tax=Portunus trituberculatus TaxID=210409 RepID=A0A5B7FMH0_PORTR|nr:hypothetical protein [Portunus trituberculatus]
MLVFVLFCGVCEAAEFRNQEGSNDKQEDITLHSFFHSSTLPGNVDVSSPPHSPSFTLNLRST